MSWDQSPPDDEQDPSNSPPPHSNGKSQKSKKEGKSVVKGCMLAILAIVGVVFLLLVSFTLVIFASFMANMSGMGGAGQTVRMADGVAITERTVSGAEGKRKIAILPVTGMLVREQYGDPVRELQAMLTLAQNDEMVEAIIVEVDSGGGTVYASDLLYEAVRDFRQRSGKPVVCLLGGVAASGGYYVSCAAESIVAHRTSITGSIGVLLPVYDATGLMNKIGVKNQTVVSGPRKDMLSPTQEKTAEEMMRLQELVESMHEMFVQVVAEGRGMTVEEVAPLANGDVYTADEAREYGLVDKVGYLETAVDEATALAKLGEGARPHVVRYGRYMSFFEMLLARAGRPTVQVQFTDDMSVQLRNKPLYLWSPDRSKSVLTSP